MSSTNSKLRTQDTTDRKVIKKMANSRKTITSSHTMRQFHLIFNTLSPHNLFFERRTGEINEREETENQEEYVPKRTKYFELCLVDFEMCGPDILWQFSKDGAPRERHRQILIKMKKIALSFESELIMNWIIVWIECFEKDLDSKVRAPSCILYIVS